MNKITNHYFKNMFVRKKKVLLLYLFVGFVVYPFTMITATITGNSNVINISKTALTLCLMLLVVLAVILPIFTFKFSLNKKNVDTYFAIPINRSHLFKTHFIAPIIGACVPLLINYLIGGLFIFNLRIYIELLVCLLLSFVVFAVLYSLVSFFVLKCNNVLDASIIAITAVVMPAIISTAVMVFLNTQIVSNGMIEISEIPLSILKLLSPIYAFSMIGMSCNGYDLYDFFVDFESIDFMLFAYYIVVGVLFAYLAYKTFKTKKGENAEQLTTSKVTYQLFLNVGLISLMMVFNLIRNDWISNIFLVVALFVIFVIVNGIANRSMRLKPMMLVRFVAILVLVNGFNYISKETEFFGINRHVIDPSNYEIIQFEYHVFNYDKQEENEVYVTMDGTNLDLDEKVLYDYLKVLQEDLSKFHKETNSSYWYYNGDDYDGYDRQLSIYYKLNAFDKSGRYVHFDLNKEKAETLLRLMENCKE